MLPLPDLDILRDEYQEARLLTWARAWLEKEELAPGIHASDLLDRRLAYWRKVEPKEPTERQVWLWLTGRVLHHFVIDSVSSGHRPEQADEGTHAALGILYSPDTFVDGRPVELKTNRAFREPEPHKLREEYGHYLEQLCTYMVLENVLEGCLWVFHINLQEEETRRTFPEPRCYRVTVTDEQFYAFEHTLAEARDQLAHALEAKDPSALPLCRAWLCGTNCAWWTSCQPPGRWPNPNRRQWPQ